VAIPEDFEHLIFSYVIPIYFNKKEYQLDTTMMSLQCNFSANVFANSNVIEIIFANLSFQILLKAATDCCRTEWQSQRDAWGCAHTAHVAQQCLNANCLQMIQKKQWQPNSLNLNPLQISHLGSDVRSFFESFTRSQI